MFKASHSALAVISGLVWMAVGLWLLPLGLTLLLSSIQFQSAGTGYYPLIGFLAPFIGGWEQTVIVLVVCGLIIGHFKGRYVLGKSARKGIERIAMLPNPADFTSIYSPKYLLLLAFMIALGISIKVFGVPSDIRGFIDVAIGAALINGALIYFRSAVALRKKSSC